MGTFVDKLDKINRSQSMRSHLVKWWDVNYVPGAEESLEYEEESTSEDNMEAYAEASAQDIDGSVDAGATNMLDGADDPELQEKLASVLAQHDITYAYDSAKELVDQEEIERKKKLEEEANEIYMRLMREAMEDEAKKQAEIDAAYQAAE